MKATSKRVRAPDCEIPKIADDPKQRKRRSREPSSLTDFCALIDSAISTPHTTCTDDR